MAFRGEFRRYQHTVLAGMDAALDNDRHHIVAPPGSGKTILGIELLRRLESPAVVFTPTTIIQRQWLDSLELFLPDGADVGRWATREPESEAPLGVYTYQLIATPAGASDAMDQLALDRWRADLAESGMGAMDAADDLDARIDTIRAAHPAEYAKELARRRQALRRELLRAPGSDVYALLHPNARALIDRIAARGVRTIVLDECHHLLDYWAIVIRALVARLERPRTIGLTATLPDLETAREHENYRDLVGPVDFETPVPAVVREGHLAPYRDLVLFVEPTERERRWLDDVAEEFQRAVADVTASDPYARWFDARLGGDLQNLLDDDGALLLAALRTAAHGGRALPAHQSVPPELDQLAGQQPPTLDDRIQLLAAFVFEALIPSGQPPDHDTARRLRRVLRAFGATVTETGVRRSRSPGDLLLAASDARAHGAARILARELEVLGDDLRGVVVTDFDRDRSGVQVVDDVIGSRAGGARRIAELLGGDDALAGVGVGLVTGRRVACTASHAVALREALHAAAAADGLDLVVDLRPGSEPSALTELVGSGRDWRPGVYVPLLTGAFVEGVVRVVVGTRALLGEGWDAPAANVLVDLTSVASPQAVQQLRGRTLRLDPARPGKVAHNWDVVCVDRRSEAGDPDLRRFMRRHGQLWGLIPPVDRIEAMRTRVRLSRTPLGAAISRDLVRRLQAVAAHVESGIEHVDPLLAVELATLPWRHVGFADASRRSLEAVADRDAVRERWKIGSPFDDEIQVGARLRPPSEVPVTAHTLRRITVPLVAAFVAALAGGFAIWFGALGEFAASSAGSLLQSRVGVVVACCALGLVFIGMAWRPGRELARLAIHGVPPDEVLADSAKAVFDAMRRAEIIHRDLPDEALRLADRSGEVVCWLEGAGVDDRAAFVEALRELHAPVVDQRWLIERTDGRLPGWMDFGLVRVTRWLVHRRTGHRPSAWLAVPSRLARSERRRAMFGAAWARRVGGGRVIDGRSAEGVVARARARATSTAGRGSAEAWRHWS